MSDRLDIVDDRLSDAAIAAELARRQARLAAGADAGVGAAGPATQPVLTWWLGDRRCATPLADLYAVSGAVPVTAVPGAPTAMIGVFGRRGVIHSLFDPSAALALPPGEGGNAAGTILLLRQDKPRIAIRVDRADGVIDVAVAAIAGDGLARIVVLDDGSTVSIVDTGRLIGHLTGQSLSVSPEG